MAPVAPGVLTTEMRWPRTFSISLARIRTVRSVAPPAGQGTMAVMGLVGFQSAAMAGALATASTRATHIRVFQVARFMISLLFDGATLAPGGACIPLTLGAGQVRAEARAHTAVW